MSQKTFEIGLVMAGAISAGAYTAGVMDFLIEALDAYEAARAAPDWDGPTHAVRVPLMAGASAGGMTSAMAALQAFHEMEHVQPGASPPAPGRNRLYSNWVSRIDLKELLKTSDLDGKEHDGVRSILCCSILDEIVHETFAMSGPAQARAWLGRGESHDVHVLMTLTNLRGVPYSFKVGGSQPLPYAMLNHGDYLDFKVGLAPKPEAGTIALDIGDTEGGEWPLFRIAALATGAFPIGLAPRPISRDTADYDTSLRVGRDTEDGFQTIKPDRIISGLKSYDFVAVDGGTIDNEPLEISRRFLGGGFHLEDDGAKATKAIVLIAPFPSFPVMPIEPGGLKVVNVLPRLANTLVQQSRFKADELDKAANEKFFSRFLISPERDATSEPAKRYPIASGVLGGFGGFVDESFRRHDFILGRRNAQAFLLHHFALSEHNPLFDGTKNREKWYVKQSRDVAAVPGAKKTFAPTTESSAQDFGLPIIPLCGGLDAEITIPAADLPKPGNVNTVAIDALIEQRMTKVAEVLVDYDLSNLTKSSWIGAELRWGARKYLAHIGTEQGKVLVDEAVAAVAAAFS